MIKQQQQQDTPANIITNLTSFERQLRAFFITNKTASERGLASSDNRLVMIFAEVSCFLVRSRVGAKVLPSLVLGRLEMV
jgi:hypothetical protein